MLFMMHVIPIGTFEWYILQLYVHILSMYKYSVFHCSILCNTQMKELYLHSSD